jgi:hypothetical protein
MPSQAYSEPLFDLFSFARRGPGRRDHLSPREIAQVARTVCRTPEVMVKVLPKSANTLAAVRKHLEYIGRKGELDLESDDGERLTGAGVGKGLVEDWDLDVDEYRRKSDLTATHGKAPARLVHKLIFSMPAGTPSEKVHTAVRNFAREEFWGQHRYALALHTDEPHPHVHLVLKAVSEQGARLNIKKATLRHWRSEFARNLRLLGVEANATERTVRGVTSKAKTDGIYRTNLRGESTYVRAQAEAVAADLLKGNTRTEPGKRTLIETRRQVENGWHSVSSRLADDGHQNLAHDVRRFVDRLPAAKTERELMRDEIVRRSQETKRQQWKRTRS